MTLDARIALQVGELALDVSLEVQAGETVALLGPNGAGKTSVLRALSGLAPIDSGEIRLGGVVFDDGADTFVPPERRPVGVVFQDHVLFPHLSVLDNIAFGLRSRGMRRREADASARAWLDRVGLADRADIRPSALSGGQTQRVALARALAIEPRLLVLDEPLAALDQRARTEVRHDLRHRMGEFTGVRVLVTHDPVDAATLADRLVIMEDGRVVQTGTLADVTARPRSPWVAELVGVNLLTGVGRGNRVELDGGRELVVAESVSGPVVAVVHAHSITLHAAAPAGSARNVWSGTVASIEPLGDRVRVRIAGDVVVTAEVTAAAVSALALAIGVPVWASVKATDVTATPA